MSDIGFIIDFWLIAALALIVALPATTAIMATAGIAAYRIRKRDPAHPLTALKWTAITIGPFWVGGLVFGSVFLANEIRHHIEEARRYFTLDKAAEINGVALPAETRVELDSFHALKVAELPAGASVTLHGASWQGSTRACRMVRSPKGRWRRPRHLTPCRAGQTTR